MDFINFSIGQNTSKELLTALWVFIGSFIILRIFSSIIISKLKKVAEKTATGFDDMMIEIVSGIKPPFYFFLALYLGIQFLVLSALVSKIITILFIITLVYEGVNALQKIIEYTAHKALSKEKGDEGAQATIKTLSVVIKIILWSVGLILVLGNLGIDVSSLIAGLGIGGVAIALAMQNILGDIFSSFSILIDKPFQVGDFIKVGNDLGVVEKIGIKTTRLRTPDGQLLIIANSELTTARVQNFKQLETRRALFNLGVVYETPKEKLEKIPVIIEELVKSTENIEFERCHFKSFGDFSLNFEVVFHAQTQDYIEYLDTVQKINYKIFDRFNKEGIEFAYPTSVEYQKKS